MYRLTTTHAALVLLSAVFVGTALPAYAADATYTYDNLNRLTSATIDGSRIEYTYDAAGNITRVLTPYAITVAKTGAVTGMVTDQAGKIGCGEDCTGVYDLNAVVTLTASGAPGVAFIGWAGACSGTDPCVVTVDGMKSVEASFTSVPADLSITKTDGRTTATPGSTTITYTIVVANAGPNSVADAAVVDAFPDELTCTWTSVAAGGASGSAGSGSTDLSETLSLPSGASVTYTATCDIDPLASGTLSNSATVTSAVPDPNPGNESATDTTTLAPTANLTLDLTATPTATGPGQQITYTLAVGNAGPSSAASVVTQQVLPSGATLVSALGTGWACSSTVTTVTCTRPSLGPSESSAITVVIDPPATPGVLTSSAAVTSATAEATPGDESDSVSFQVFGPPTITGVTTVAATTGDELADGGVTDAAITQLILQASHELADPAGDSDPGDVTNPASYRLFRAQPDGTYTSTTCGDASDITILAASYGIAGVDAIALDLAGPAALAAGEYRLVACGAGTDPLGDVYGSALDGNADGTGGDDFRLDFEVLSTNLLANPNLDTALTSWDLTSEQPDDVAHDATVDAGAAATSGTARLVNLTGAGSTLAISQCVPVTERALYAVAGKARTDATGPVFPTATAHVEAFDGLACAGLSLGTTDLAAVTFTTPGAWVPAWGDTVAAPLWAQSARVTFQVTGDELSAAVWLDDLRLVATGTVEAAADLAVTKTDGVTAAVPGQGVTYTVAVSNEGPDPVVDAAVADTIPASLTCSWASVAAGGASGSAGSGSGSIAETLAMPVASTMTYTVACTVDPAATGVLSNTATVMSGTADPVPGNNSATDTTNLTPAADLWLLKESSAPEAGPGAVLDYTLSVGNQGPSTATGAVVEDVLPSGVAFVSASGAGWSCSENAGTVTCTRAAMAPLEQGQITVTVTMPTAAGVVVNTATISSATAESSPSDETDTASVEVIGPPTIVRVGSVAETESGAVVDGMNTYTTITQLLVAADHELDGPIFPSSFRLFVGDDTGAYSSSTCFDPTDVPIGSVTYGHAGAYTAALYLDLPAGLPAAWYRLLACGTGTDPLHDLFGNAIDGNADGTGGDDFVLDFRVRVSNLLVNPNFDDGLAGWTVSSQSPGDVAHDPLVDASNAPSSGSARLVNLTGVGAQLALSQCVAVAGEGTYLLAGVAQADSTGAAAPEVTALIEAFDAAGCAGASLGSADAGGFTGDTAGLWLEPWHTYVEMPAAAQSARVTFLVTGDEASAEAWLDNVQLYLGGFYLFADGFETGDASRWSGTVGMP